MKNQPIPLRGKWVNRYEDDDTPPPPTHQPSEAALAAARATVYCLPDQNIVGVWAYEFTVADGDAERVAGNLIHELAIQFDAFAAQAVVDGRGKEGV